MANKAHDYRDRDCQRIMRNARRVGLEPNLLKVKLPNGTEITVADTRQGEADRAAANPWDEVLTNAAHEKRPS